MQLTNIETAIRRRDDLIEKQAKEIKEFKKSQKKLMKALTDLIINGNSLNHDKFWDKAFDAANDIDPDWSCRPRKQKKA